MAASYTLEQAQQQHLPILRLLNQALGGSSIVIDCHVCVVGARRLVHLPLSDASISKAQALMICDASGVYIRDLASRNRTFVNDQPISEVRLEANDLIRFGPYIYQCEGGFDPSAEMESPVAAELWLNSGIGSREIVPLELHTFVIGSRSGCDLVLDGPDVALAHAVIFVRDGKRYVRDLSSYSGTLVNDAPCREIELKAGDIIGIGTSRISYHPIEATVTFDDETVASGDVNADTKITDALEGVADEAAPDEPLPIAFDDEAEVPVNVESIKMPWEDSDPLELDLVSQESSR